MRYIIENLNYEELSKALLPLNAPQRIIWKHNENSTHYLGSLTNLGGGEFIMKTERGNPSSSVSRSDYEDVWTEQLGYSIERWWVSNQSDLENMAIHLVCDTVIMYNEININLENCLDDQDNCTLNSFWTSHSITNYTHQAYAIRNYKNSSNWFSHYRELNQMYWTSMSATRERLISEGNDEPLSENLPTLFNNYSEMLQHMLNNDVMSSQEEPAIRIVPGSVAMNDIWGVSAADISQAFINDLSSLQYRSASGNIPVDYAAMAETISQQMRGIDVSQGPGGSAQLRIQDIENYSDVQGMYNCADAMSSNYTLMVIMDPTGKRHLYIDPENNPSLCIPIDTKCKQWGMPGYRQTMLYNNSQVAQLVPFKLSPTYDSSKIPDIYSLIVKQPKNKLPSDNDKKYTGRSPVVISAIADLIMIYGSASVAHLLDTNAPQLQS